MTEFKCKIHSLQFTLDKKALLTLEVESNAKSVYDKFKDKTLSAALKLFKNRRSNNANSLCWELCTKIADLLRTDKDSVYVRMLKMYGQSELISVKSEINLTGYVKYFDEAGTSRLNGTDFTHYRVYKGSSEYDTREMSVFLDGIVYEAKELGIDVLSERELSLLKEDWKQGEN